jgi:hypothetical protein
LLEDEQRVSLGELVGGHYRKIFTTNISLKRRELMLIHTYTCDNTLFPVVPSNYQKYRNRDENKQDRGENVLF